jgi:hypothetical protein
MVYRSANIPAAPLLVGEPLLKKASSVSREVTTQVPFFCRLLRSYFASANVSSACAN